MSMTKYHMFHLITYIGGITTNFCFRNLKKNHHLQPKMILNGEVDNEQLKFNVTIKMEESIKNK